MQSAPPLLPPTREVLVHTKIIYFSFPSPGGAFSKDTSVLLLLLRQGSATQDTGMYVFMCPRVFDFRVVTNYRAITADSSSTTGWFHNTAAVQVNQSDIPAYRYIQGVSFIFFLVCRSPFSRAGVGRESRRVERTPNR